MAPSVQENNFDLYCKRCMLEKEGKDDGKIHINTMCMCITYRISFVCGLTNPSEKERINNKQCAKNVSCKPSKLEPGPQNMLRLLLRVEARSKRTTLELFIRAMILIRSKTDFKSAV